MVGGPEDAIAVVGMAGRFPGAADVERLWENTLLGRSAVTRRTDPSAALLWARGELDDVASFDPAFFGMSPRDALVIGPQHRILLECAWEALADAAADGQEPIRRTAVFAGANYSGYRELLDRAGTRVSAVEFESGTDKDFLATTIAYRLGLEGPCMTVQTACSSSLVAVHQAGQALLEYEADQALAGGVSVVLPHTPGWRFEPRGIHSADGTCRPFDADANGTVMGDGAGMVVLRRLEDAIADGCRIYAVIRGSAVNNDGSRKIGYAAPSVPGQAEVIRAAQARAGIDPGEISYVETHGTGTPLGDRVEFQALVDVFAAQRSSGSRCALGSVKGALGHLDVAAGVVGLIRVALALHHATLPGTVNHHRPHPDLGIGNTRFHVPRDPAPWKAPGPRRAGVSSFGIGGTNAHVILEEVARRDGASTSKRRTLVDDGYQPSPYWPVPSPAAHIAPSADAGAQVSVEYRRATWHEWAPDERAPDRPAYARIILLADEGIIGDSLYDELRTQGHDVEWPGAAGPAGTPTEHRMTLLAPADVVGLLGQLTAPGPMLVVCALALSAGEQGWRGYDVLTALASGQLTNDLQNGPIDVVLLTQAVYPVTGDEPGDPGLAAVAGLARVLSMESPATRVRVVDLPIVDASALAEAANEALRWQDEPVLARRGRRWWHPIYERIARPAKRHDTDGREARAGVSVVFGVGQVGAVAARVLAQAGGTLVLAVRPGSGIERGAALAHELQSARTNVLVETCDAADPVQIDMVLARLAERFGTLDQVVLAAGISGDRAYQLSGDLPSWRGEDHFRVKVDGVAALAAAAATHDIRRVVLMSSLAGVLGAISLGPYSAAAAAMDCCATRWNLGSTDWLSVGWDAWQHDDQEASAHESRMVQDGLTSAEAESAMSDVLLSGAAGHLLVVKGDFDPRWDRFVRQPLRHAMVVQVQSTNPPATSDVRQAVLEAWRSCLADPELGLDDDLLQRGADSLNSIEVLVALGGQLGVTLPTDLIFEAQTPRRLAAHVAKLLAQARPGANRVAIRGWRNEGPTIWCLHPISGSADSFTPLADLLEGHQVRAVVGQPLAEIHNEDSIESQARGYHDLLSASSGEPPAVLVGWSYGGILAFEIAQLVFLSTGERPVVVLLDIPAPTTASSRSIDEVNDGEIIMAIISHRVREKGDQSTMDLAGSWPDRGDDATAHVLARLRGDGAVPPSFTEDVATRLTSGYRCRMRAVERYHPTPYDGHLVLLTASELEFGDTRILE
ncbi:MAG: hypothetical protein QOE61_5455, partial [Micromonosporaceae bacterium]|nr:hypothetical protein [Micromonosporaceae bacterium]